MNAEMQMLHGMLEHEPTRTKGCCHGDVEQDDWVKVSCNMNASLLNRFWNCMKCAYYYNVKGVELRIN